jgi:hypothetical protein
MTRSTETGVTAAAAAAAAVPLPSLAGVPVADYELPIARQSQLEAYERPELRAEDAEYSRSAYPVGGFDVTFDVGTRRQPNAQGFTDWPVTDIQGAGFRSLEQNPTFFQQDSREALPAVRLYPRLSDRNWIRLQQKSQTDDHSQVGDRIELTGLPQVGHGVGEFDAEDFEINSESETLRDTGRGKVLVVQRRVAGDNPTGRNRQGGSTAVVASGNEDGHRLFGNRFLADLRGKKSLTGKSMDNPKLSSRRHRHEESSGRANDEDEVDGSEDEDVAAEAGDEEEVYEDSDSGQID